MQKDPFVLCWVYRQSFCRHYYGDLLWCFLIINWAGSMPDSSSVVFMFTLAIWVVPSIYGRYSKSGSKCKMWRFIVHSLRPSITRNFACNRGLNVIVSVFSWPHVWVLHYISTDICACFENKAEARGSLACNPRTHVHAAGITYGNQLLDWWGVHAQVTREYRAWANVISKWKSSRRINIANTWKRQGKTRGNLYSYSRIRCKFWCLCLVYRLIDQVQLLETCQWRRAVKLLSCMRYIYITKRVRLVLCNSVFVPKGECVGRQLSRERQHSRAT